MNEKGNIEAKLLICKSGDLLLARRSQRLRRAGGAYSEQALKDIEIVKGQIQDIRKIEWHCFDGVDDLFIENVRKELLQNGLKVEDFIIIQY